MKKQTKKLTWLVAICFVSALALSACKNSEEHPSKQEHPKKEHPTKP